MSIPPPVPALDRARRKAYVRLLPLLFVSYVIAYVDRVNVGFAKLNMQKDLAPLGFGEAAFGFGMGVFFIGYLLLEIPGTLLVEHWSARKWISRIMISWGVIAALTAFVHYRVPFVTDAAGAGARFTTNLLATLPDYKRLSMLIFLLTWLSGVLLLAAVMAFAAGPFTNPTAAPKVRQIARRFFYAFLVPTVLVLGLCLVAALASFRGELNAFVFQFFGIRFLLGLAEAGFYPGVIVYLTHWFPRRDRTKALAWFFIGTPIAQIIGPLVSTPLMGIGTGGAPRLLGLVGWQWVFIVWGVPAVVLGVLVLIYLTDRPHEAKWLEADEREALEGVLLAEKEEQKAQVGHMTVAQALANSKVLLLAAAYFFVVTGNYGVEMYMASILKDWYKLDVKNIGYLIIIPPIGSLLGQVFVGWNSDRVHERRWHATLPILLGAAALVATPESHGKLWLTIALFTVAMTGLKAYLPAFWALPSLLMTEAAAAASIGLINSFGNLGGWVGPTVIGALKESTDSYRTGLWYLALSMTASVAIILALGIGRRPGPAEAPPVDPDPLPEALREMV